MSSRACEELEVIDECKELEVIDEGAQGVREGDNACYVLFNATNAATYNGYTVDVRRRLRQHNGELAGGARATSREVARGVTWQLLCVVTSPVFDKHTALSFEWHVKRPTGARRRPPAFSGPLGRLNSLRLVFDNPKFAAAPHFTLRVCPEFLARAQSLYGDCAPRVRVEPL